MDSFSDLINERIEALRPKLQDTSRRNPLINNVLSAKSASFVRIVDEKPQSIYDDLASNDTESMKLVPLPPVDIDPPDEDTTEFKNAFQNTQATDEQYVKTIEAIDFEYDAKAIDKQENADRELKDRVREMLGMPPRPKSEQYTDLVNHAKSHGINPSSTLPEPSAIVSDDRFDDDQLQTLLLPKTFQSRMSRILSKARMYQEERGLDVVYIVLGYLKWTLPNAEKQDDFKSPLLLIPVSLRKSKSVSGETYSVTKLGDPIFNPSLAHKLTVEAKLDLSKIREIAESENADVEALFLSIADLKPKNMYWSVLREASFGVYPFQGIDLYYDLDTEHCDFSEFPVVSELMVGKGESDSSVVGSFSEADVESEKGQSLVPHLVLDADSTQFIALLKVANNENVALEGPPGSGKSQTIVNAIANAIYFGKKVLFVAQKATALEVVFSRLQALGLEQFVLPLMGGYGNTEAFYDAVGRRLSLRESSSSKDLASLKQQFIRQRDKLGAYINVLIKPVIGTGMSVHQVLGLAISHSDSIASLPLELKTVSVVPEEFVEGFSPQDLDAAASQITEWHRLLQDTIIPKDSIWFGTKASEVNTAEINKALVSARTALLEIESAMAALDATSQSLMKTYLDNDYERIEYEVSGASKVELYRQVHGLAQSIGVDELGVALGDLVGLNDEIKKIADGFRLSSEQLTQFSRLETELASLSWFANRFKLERIETGAVDKVLNNLRTKSETLARVTQYQEKFVSLLGSQLSLGTILAYRPILDAQELLLQFKEYLRAEGFQGAVSEIIKARASYRSATYMLDQNSIPDLVTVKKIRDTIQNGGIFAFLSAEVKSAKRKAAEMVSDLKAGDSKKSFVNALDELLELTREFKRLALADYIDVLDKDADSRISQLSFAIDELQSINNTTGLNESLSLNLSCFGELGDATELLGGLEAADLSWEALDKLSTKVSQLIAEVESQYDSVRTAESFCVEIEKNWSSALSGLQEASKKARTMLVTRKASLEAIGLQPQSDDELVSMFAAYKDYSNMSQISIDLTFSENGSEVLDLVATHLSALTEIQSSAEVLARAKGEGASPESRQSINELMELLEQHRKDQRGLDRLIARKSINKEARNRGLDQLLDKLESRTDLELVFSSARAAIVSSLRDQVEKDYGASLLEFDGVSLSNARSQLQQLDRQIIQLSPNEVASKAVSQSNPPAGISYGKKSEYTDLALLLHELQKRRRTPSRKILKRAQGALLELFPCWMMVPTAVAQHLPRQGIFDLVIIDEASQMTPENSISALMRGRNVLIAGDTNQLPPTNFFKGLAADEDEDEDVTTTEESILELANIQFHPKHRLLWHYRSKHEDLIAFSNHYVYDSELVIFPSPKPATEGLGISLVQVNGTFQRGINPAEAQVMLEAIVQFMRETPHRSLGAAVMNQSQMEQLDALVLREAESNKAVSTYIDHWGSAREGLEKFFVKNLENVQGDERDVIFVGTVYGRDPQGKFYQRFGPINGPAGKRRLNVLFSRAKEQIVTFSSIPLSDFNPSPTNEGATLLRRWLEFSATKQLGEVAHAHDRAGYTDSPFEDHVIEVVRSLGYEAVPQVGVSSYFIDIGVKHPSYPFGYICGLECDGASYHSSRSARDRDRLREEVLNRLGWSLYRIWSTDWFRDALGCRALLKQYLSERLAEITANMPETVFQTVKKSEDLAATNSLEQETNHTETANEGVASAESLVAIELGSKFLLRYLDGPRAGAVSKFWFQYKTNDQSFNLEGYTTLGADSPLGAAVEGAEQDEICSYQIGTQEVHVQIIDIEEQDN